MRKRISIIIPSYNGVKLLSKYLPGVIVSMEQTGQDNELIIIDNGSTDGTGDFLGNMGKAVKVITVKENSGFINACNLGMAKAGNHIVILLNNDVEVRKDFITPLLEGFNENDTFAIVARSLLPHADMNNESIVCGSFNDGNFKLLRMGLEDKKAEPKERCTNLYASGGFSAFDREKFLRLGGFDPLFFPFYWEDVDISYRAWKMGWKVIYEPRSIVFHHSHRTIGRDYSHEYTEFIDLRNKYLFFWKNFTDEEIIKKYAENIFHKERNNWKGNNQQERRAFFEAFRKIRDVMAKRIALHEGRLSDREVLRISANLRVE